MFFLHGFMIVRAPHHHMQNQLQIRSTAASGDRLVKPNPVIQDTESIQERYRAYVGLGIFLLIILFLLGTLLVTTPSGNSTEVIVSSLAAASTQGTVCHVGNISVDEQAPELCTFPTVNFWIEETQTVLCALVPDPICPDLPPSMIESIPCYAMVLHNQTSWADDPWSASELPCHIFLVETTPDSQSMALLAFVPVPLQFVRHSESSTVVWARLVGVGLLVLFACMALCFLGCIILVCAAIHKGSKLSTWATQVLDRIPAVVPPSMKTWIRLEEGEGDGIVDDELDTTRPPAPYPLKVIVPPVEDGPPPPTKAETPPTPEDALTLAVQKAL